MLNHYKLTLEMADKQIDLALKFQILDEDSVYYGTPYNFRLGYPELRSCSGIASLFIAAYYNKDSKYYKDELMLERAILAMQYVKEHTHPDGSTDLLETNFHDATNNGFMIHHLGPALLVMKNKSENTELEKLLYSLSIEFIEASMDAMVNLGFHTPNHRWVLSGALAYAYNLTKDERCLEAINKYLAEGIDCDENGEYTERSAGIYSAVCNDALMMMASQLDMPELFDHVARNLTLARMFIMPDNTINTLNSTRQDIGKAPDYRRYYENYLLMALYTGNEEFAYTADEMLKKNLAEFEFTGNVSGVPKMSLFMLHPEWIEKFEKLNTKKPEADYERLMPLSGIMCKRIGDVALTLIAKRHIFCRLQKGSHTITMRFGSPFFGKGNLLSDTIEQIENGYRLHVLSKADYMAVFDEAPGTSVWAEMDHSKRRRVAEQEYEITCDVYMTENSLKMKFITGGCGNVPCKLEMMLEAGGLLDLGVAEFFTNKGDYVYLKGEETKYIYNDGTSFKFKNAFYKHRFGKNMRNTPLYDENSLTLCLTDFTNSEREFEIEF